MSVVRASAATRRAARDLARRRDEAIATLRSLTDDDLLAMLACVEETAQVDGYGSGNRPRGQLGVASDPTGTAVVAAAGDGRGPDGWVARPDPTAMDVLRVRTGLVELHGLAVLVARAVGAVLHRPERHPESPGNRIAGECRRCHAVISGAGATGPQARPDHSHGGLCEECHDEYLSLDVPRASIDDWTRRGGRCDSCDRTVKGSDADRLRHAGTTGLRFCKHCHERWRRDGGVVEAART